MQLALNQPYFFPYFGFFQLIDSVDLFIAFDTVQYIKGGWVNRNRIKSGWLTVPVKKHHHHTIINDIRVLDYRFKIFNQLQIYKKAPYFNDVFELVDDCFFTDTRNLSELNTRCLRKVCDYMGIKTPIVRFSDMSLNIDPVWEPGDWALNISKALGATEYINLPNGEKLFDKRRWKKIKLKFIKTIPGLSIIHDLMYEMPVFRK